MNRLLGVSSVSASGVLVLAAFNSESAGIEGSFRFGFLQFFLQIAESDWDLGSVSAGQYFKLFVLLL